jgi:hypothetical protein
MYPLSKYKFYVTPDHKTIAVSTYAGKTIKGIAKTNPKDKYDERFGKELAAARCAVKVAKKRRARAEKMLNKAEVALYEAYKYRNKMNQYFKDAKKDLVEAKLDLANLLI